MIVMKFGGTSLGSAECIERVLSLVKERIEREPVMVISAVGGITNMLLSIAGSSIAGKNRIDELLAPLRERHHGILRGLGLETSLLAGEFSKLKKMLHGVKLLGELSPRTLDRILSFGEIMSSRIVATHFSGNGLRAKALAGWEAGFVTDNRFTRAEILPETHDNIRKALAKPRYVPVVTGFIAKSMNGQVTTLGRGGSDYTAAIIGSARGAEEIEIWTDVNGMMTADEAAGGDREHRGREGGVGQPEPDGGGHRPGGESRLLYGTIRGRRHDTSPFGPRRKGRGLRDQQRHPRGDGGVRELLPIG